MKNKQSNIKAIDFGTAGIRGKVGHGIDHLSHAHIQRIAHGLAKYLIAKHPNKNEILVVIGRDNRRYSNKYAKVIAEILDSYGKIKIILSRKITPTPFVSYLIIRNKADAGVNITASHNPKEYNGVKLYNNFGSQCLPEEIAEIKQYFKPFSSYSDEFSCKYNWPTSKNIRNVKISEWNEYVEKVCSVGGNVKFDKNNSNIKLAYSPLHGTGSVVAEKVFNKLGLTKGVDVFFEPTQFKQDRNFTSCEYPNPERDDVYKLVEKLGQKHNCDILVVTDPDADRVGVRVLHNGNYVHLNGNETASITIQYLLENSTDSLKNKYLVYSYVSSNLPELIAKEFGLQTYVVPTGFKWIGKMIVEKDEDMFYGFEESYGSLINHDIARDKDAIQSLVTVAKMAQFYKQKGLTLIDVLDKIHLKHGFVSSKTIDIEIGKNTDLSVLQDKFKNLFSTNKKIHDYNLETDFMKSNMIKLFFDDKPDWLAMRPSGTEPKIKFYVFAYGNDAIDSQKKLDYYINLIKKNVL
ncbi:phospho-sugar mutase [Mycoplasma sp. ES3225-GEN-MYC]|uniref:phospho-sugar mutase n=1 Tax=Mycoplasma miroungigenitalium TaxID=754515 RepID=UPI001488090A|nr:phospho-sugar mutase [Mycoplasma miroungigenitalium]MBU4691855.1 phospho-sugar mutase [Mycoplasma miroungigenitalium]